MRSLIEEFSGKKRGLWEAVLIMLTDSIHCDLYHFLGNVTDPGLQKWGMRTRRQSKVSVHAFVTSWLFQVPHTGTSPPLVGARAESGREMQSHSVAQALEEEQCCVAMSDEVCKLWLVKTREHQYS